MKKHKIRVFKDLIAMYTDAMGKGLGAGEALIYRKS